ncbi:MAG TPA: hypothetical protein VF138_11280 [Caulobacteraceae bacterium]
MNRTILLASADAAYAARMIPRLIDRGFHVVGPVSNARLALALAASVPIRVALIGEQLSGMRDGRALARALRANWGVPSVVVSGEAPAANSA